MLGERLLLLDLRQVGAQPGVEVERPACRRAGRWSPARAASAGVQREQRPRPSGSLSLQVWREDGQPSPASLLAAVLRAGTSASLHSRGSAWRREAHLVELACRAGRSGRAAGRRRRAASPRRRGGRGCSPSAGWGRRGRGRCCRRRTPAGPGRCGRGRPPRRPRRAFSGATTRASCSLPQSAASTCRASCGGRQRASAAAAACPSPPRLKRRRARCRASAPRNMA